MLIGFERQFLEHRAGLHAVADDGAGNFIRATLIELYGEEVGSRIPLLYGGSVNPENAPELLQRENIDGLFIGRSAWQADKFEAIIRTVLPLWREK